MSNFDFAKAIEYGNKESEIDKLMAIILGASGAGKSGTCGTFGVPTLMIYSAGESHGVNTAKQFGKDIYPIPYDINLDTGEALTADEAYDNLLKILDDIEAIKALKVGAIVLDSLTQLETIIMNTKNWSALVTQKYKGNVSYAGPVTLAMFSPVKHKMQMLRKKLNVHIVVTAALNVKALGDDGSIVEAAPAMHGYNVAESILKDYRDVLILGQVTINTKDGTKQAPYFQLQSSVTKSTADFTTKEVRKLLNCSNRLNGIRMDTLPSRLPADLRLISYIAKTGEMPKPKKKEA